MDTIQGKAVVDSSGNINVSGTRLAAIQAAVEDTSVLTANGAYRTAADGWTQVLVNAATGASSGTVTAPEGATKAIIVVANATDVTVAPQMIAPFAAAGNIYLIIASETVATGTNKTWAGLAGNAASSHGVVPMLNALIPGLPIEYAFTAVGRSSGTYTVTIYWGS